MDIRIFLIIPLAFVCEFIDSSLGMGYGTTLAPILLLMGLEPLQIVPAILASEFVAGITAAFFHHSLRNVNLRPSSKDGKTAIMLSIFSVTGVIAAVFLAIRLPPKVLKIWIGSIVVLMGAIILIAFNRKPRFSWVKIIILGVIASFNKGISGGGYGPLVMGGQILSGVGVKNAIGITSLSESMTCLAGILLYSFSKSQVDWTFAPYLMVGALLSVPFTAHTVKRVSEKKVKIAIAVLIVILGCLTLYKAFLH